MQRLRAVIVAAVPFRHHSVFEAKPERLHLLDKVMVGTGIDHMYPRSQLADPVKHDITRAEWAHPVIDDPDLPGFGFALRGRRLRLVQRFNGHRIGTRYGA